MQILFQNFELNKIIFYLNNNFLNILCNFSIFPSFIQFIIIFIFKIFIIICNFMSTNLFRADYFLCKHIYVMIFTFLN